MIAALAARLTARDRRLLRLLYEHRVLTSGQINELAFGNLRHANARLLTLYAWRAVDRFRPFVRTGSAPYHYVLDEAGAAVVAAAQGTTVAELGYRRTDTLAVAHSQQLAHLVGANGFFTALAAAARANPSGAALPEWLSERRCLQVWQGRIRPDGHGRWQENGKEVTWFLEYDTGSETLQRVAAKLGVYAELAETTGTAAPVLFWLPTARREAALRELLHDAPVPAATASPDTLALAADQADRHDGPAGPVWLPADRPGPRLRLADLQDAWPHFPPPAPTLIEGTSETPPPYAPTRPQPAVEPPPRSSPSTGWPPHDRT